MERERAESGQGAGMGREMGAARNGQQLGGEQQAGNSHGACQGIGREKLRNGQGAGGTDREQHEQAGNRTGAAAGTQSAGINVQVAEAA